MRVAVTGASGYIGRALTPALRAAGHEPVPLGRSSAPGVFMNREDDSTGTLGEHIAGADRVIHLAGQLVTDPAANVDAYYQANVQFTETVMEAAHAAGVAGVVHASTRLVYPKTLSKPAVEMRDASPDTAYGLSKLWAENVTRFHANRAGMDSISLRIGQVTGGEHPGLGVINAFIRQARERNRVTINGRGVAVRDFVHVDDVAAACVAALDHSGNWTAVNIGGSRAMTIAEIARTVADACPGDVTLEHEPATDEDMSCYALDPQHARSTLRWAPTWTPQDMIIEAFEKGHGQK